MAVNLSKFLHSKTGRIIMSILLGFGLASIFRSVCTTNNKECVAFHAPPLDEIKNKIYKTNGKCVKYTPVATKCNTNAKIIEFE